MEGWNSACQPCLSLLCESEVNNQLKSKLAHNGKGISMGKDLPCPLGLQNISFWLKVSCMSRTSKVLVDFLASSYLITIKFSFLGGWAEF